MIKKGILTVIVAATVIGALCIYPLQKVPLIPCESNYGKKEVWGTGNITDGKAVSQDFYVEPTRLQSISIYMQNLNEVKAGNLILTVNYGREELKRIELPLSEIVNYEWTPVECNVWLGKEGLYTYTITTDVKDSDVLQIFETDSGNAPKENREYRYCGETRDNLSLAVNYRFLGAAHNVSEAIPFIAIVVLAGGLLLESVNMIKAKKEEKDAEIP